MGRISKRLGVALMASTMLVVSGCGEEPISLTDEEENIIVNYAAHTVAKYNNYQTEGRVYIAETADDGTDVAEDDSEEALDETTDTQQPDLSEEDMTDTEDTSQDEEEATQEEPGAATETASLNQALGLGDVAATYNGYEVSGSYVEGDYYSMEATSGNVFLILKVDLTNNASEAMNCNLLAANPAFTATVNGSTQVKAETTILLNDLSTYEGDMAVGETVSTVLLFQISEELAADIQSVDLTVAINGTSYQVDLN